jgi:hypothetical protein
MDTREVLFITQEMQDNDHKDSKIDEYIYEEDFDEETVENTKTTERGGVNQWLLCLNNI